MAIPAQFYPNNLGFSLCASQDLMMDNGCGTGNGGFTQSCFNSQQKHQQQLEQYPRQLYNERQRNQNMFIDTNSLFPYSKANNVDSSNNNNHPSISIPTCEGLGLQFEKQMQEVDQYIRLQNEKLMIMLQKQRKQQLATLLKVESVSLYLLRQKDEEIAQAAKKNLEIEDILRRLQAENQAWRRVAEENEAMVLSLNNTLDQMKERAYYCFNNGVAADEESCRGGRRRNWVMEEAEEGTGENSVGCWGVGGDVEQITRKMMVCKGCNSRSSCFLFLPLQAPLLMQSLRAFPRGLPCLQDAKEGEYSNCLEVGSQRQSDGCHAT